MTKNNHSEFEKLALIHNDRINKSQEALVIGNHKLEELKSIHEATENSLNNIDLLLDEVDSLLAQQNIVESKTNKLILLDMAEDLQKVPNLNNIETYDYEKLEIIDFNTSDTIDNFFEKHFSYAKNHHINLNQNITSILSYQELQTLNKLIDENFTYKKAQCDQYDYMIAGTIGILGGLIDIFLVGAPNEGKLLTKWADSTVDSSVQRFAKLFGWKGAKEGSDSTKSAIGFLERKFKVNYDHRHGGDVDNLFKMNTLNHHIKNLAHSPDLIGLFFSILDQYTNTAHFVDNGKIISINTEQFELSGTTVISKIFSGFINWLGHLFSDIAGSSGSQTRGSGIPIPFYSLFQFINIGSFGQYRQTFATVCVQVFEKGYDLRHGLALSIPVIISELLVRVLYTIKRVFYHKENFSLSLPFSSTPELHRMLLVTHGTLCLLDVGDAAIRSGGNMVTFLLRTNLIAWTRFSLLVIKEINLIIKQGKIDKNSLDKYIDEEYERLITSNTF